MRKFVALASWLALAGCVSSQDAPPQQATYANPVLDSDFPDPAVLKAGDGYYYAYATQGAAAGQMRNIQAARSKDLVRWEVLGDALPVKPSWASKTQDFWAPDVKFAGGRYYLYYSAKPMRPSLTRAAACALQSQRRSGRGAFPRYRHPSPVRVRLHQHRSDGL
jgi:arabinan endo-1,5-alpha-L-arabinosidase